MNILVVGATGATGRLLVEQLLNRGHQVKAIVRSVDTLPEAVKNHPNFSPILASILDLSATEMAQHVNGCQAVASCLGHNLTLKGIFAPPRRLVTDATRRLCQAIKANKSAQMTKFVLMNTTGNRNQDRNEQISFAERVAIGLMRVLVPPQADNEQAANYLRVKIGQQDGAIEWAAVRPDGLINEAKVTDYEVHPSPIRSAIFNAGVTSRINVAHFMASLITEDETWHKWKGQMPVIYNKTSS
jgi:nucleoside-diphosphate-sugar epimerase